MPDPSRPVSEDPVKQLILRVNVLLAEGSPDAVRARDLLEALAALAPRELVRFDEQSRGWLNGLDGSRIPALRGEPCGDQRQEGVWKRTRRGRSAPPPPPTDVAMELSHVLGLVSGDGRERERAVRAAPMNTLTAQLLTIRCVDWVAQVREAALSRLETCPREVLVSALPLAAELAVGRKRGGLLDAFLDVHLSDTDLRSACRTRDVLTRRAAWRLLAARGVVAADELCGVAARDADVLVRAVAANAVASLPAARRRELAEILVRDRVGQIAVTALEALVGLDGPGAILPALTARPAALRRAARDWAKVRGIDARAVYEARLASTPGDALALVALAEIGDPRDTGLFAQMLDDPRSRVRAAGLRALARVDRLAGRQAAIDAIAAGATGRPGRAAAEVLREGVPSSSEGVVFERLALDESRPVGERLRALSLLTPSRWLHLAVLLEAEESAAAPELRVTLRAEIAGWSGARVRRAPTAPVRARIERLLPGLDPGRRRWIEFVLRTSV